MNSVEFKYLYMHFDGFHRIVTDFNGFKIDLNGLDRFLLGFACILIDFGYILDGFCSMEDKGVLLR